MDLGRSRYKLGIVGSAPWTAAIENKLGSGRSPADRCDIRECNKVLSFIQLVILICSETECLGECRHKVQERVLQYVMGNNRSIDKWMSNVMQP